MSTDGPGTSGPGGPGDDDFDLDAFEAAFAEHFGETVAEPELPEATGSAAQEAGAGAEVTEPGSPAGPADTPAEPAGADGPTRPDNAGSSAGSAADGPAGETDEAAAASSDATGTAGDPDPGDAADSDDEPAAGDQAAGASNTMVTAVVLTPLAHAPALAKIMGLAGMDWPVIATRTGAIAASAQPAPGDDLSALTGELPEEIVNVAKALSHTSKFGVVLLSARITHSGEEGPGGRVSADRYVAGEHTESIPPGLVTNGADEVVEQLVLGEIAPEDVPGVLDPAVEAARGAQAPGNPTKRGPRRRRS